MIFAIWFDDVIYITHCQFWVQTNFNFYYILATKENILFKSKLRQTVNKNEDKRNFMSGWIRLKIEKMIMKITLNAFDVSMCSCLLSNTWKTKYSKTQFLMFGPFSFRCWEVLLYNESQKPKIKTQTQANLPRLDCFCFLKWNVLHCGKSLG